jgi:hypothetical protein
MSTIIVAPLAAACGGDSATPGGSVSPASPAPRPSSGVTGSSVTPPGDSLDDPTAAIRRNEIEADPRVVRLRPYRWTRALPGKDTVTLRVEFATDGSPCQRLGRVDVEESARAVRVTLQVGQAPGVDCIGPRTQQAAPNVTMIRLAAPLAAREVTDGSL